MALGDFQVFNDFAYRAFAVTLQQQVELFNAASRNALSMTTMAWAGDYKQKAAFENLASLVGNRDPSSTSAASTHALSELLQIEVKVGYGTPNIEYTNTAFDWTNRSPEEAGTLFGNAVAEGSMAYMLNSLLASAVAAMDDADVTFDGTAAVASLDSLNSGAGKFGDRQSAITTWVMHSKSMNDIWGTSLANSNRLFEFGTVAIVSDAFGRPMIMTDSDALHFDNAGTENYHQLGLVSGGLVAEDQGDMRLYTDVDLSEENAKQVLKMEGSFGVGIKGYTWNTAVTKPNDAALALTTNWSRIANLGLKDTAGVVVTTL
tara:strand:- start:44 stop:997 length:954 start_codon:yes stop_codon:yes gene_type:complete